MYNSAEEQIYYPFRQFEVFDRYNKQYCEVQIKQELDKHIIRVKDSSNMFYNRIEALANDNDQDYN